MRITRSDASLPQVERGTPVTVSIDGQPVVAYAGETVAAVLLAQGRRTFRQTTRTGQGRGLYCGMGICYDCLVTVDGTPNVRACLTPVAAGTIIETRVTVSHE